MISESRKRFSLCLCFLFVGILIGIAFDAEFRPNHIRFWVNPVGNLSFIPRTGDKIEWFELSTGKPMNINFLGGSPCVGAFNPCIIGNIPKTTAYLYTCTGADDPTFTCNDPQGGPVSGTDGMQAPVFPIRIFDLIQNVLALISQIFGHSAYPGTPGATQNRAGSIGADQAKIAKSPSGSAKPSAAYPPIQAQVACEAGSTHVYVPQQSPNPDYPIQANVTQKVLWTTSSAKGFSISLPDPSTCSENVSPLPNGICTVAKAGSYTASIPSCTANTYESITLQQ